MHLFFRSCAQRLPVRLGVFPLGSLTPDIPYDSRWDLYSLSAIRVSTLLNFSHIFIVTVVSVLEVHSRPVLQSRNSIGSLTIPRPPTALDSDDVCDVHRPAMNVATQSVSSLFSSKRDSSIVKDSGKNDAPLRN